MGNGTILTKNGRLIALNRTFKGTPDYTAPSQFKVGIGTTTPATSDTAMEYARPITGTETVDACDATAGWTDSADCTLSVNSTTYKVGTGALNWTKDGTASVNANSYKTTTSLNFTSKEMDLWIYIADAATYALMAVTSCLTIRFGSDSSNYYEWLKDKADLAVGWNYINNLTSSNADNTQGTPVIAACDYTFIQFTSVNTSDVWAAGKVIVDDIRLISSGDYLKTVVSGYPTLDETNLEATMRSLLLTTDANGHSLTEYGLFNTDGTPLMFSHVVHTSISKTTSVQIVYVEKDKVT